MERRESPGGPRNGTPATPVSHLASRWPFPLYPECRFHDTGQASWSQTMDLCFNLWRLLSVVVPGWVLWVYRRAGGARAACCGSRVGAPGPAGWVSAYWLVGRVSGEDDETRGGPGRGSAARAAGGVPTADGGPRPGRRPGGVGCTR